MLWTEELERECVLPKDKASFILSLLSQKGQPQTSDLAGPGWLGCGASEKCLDGSVSENQNQNGNPPTT